MTQATSTNHFDYEILIRRYDMANRYASYCPQLGIMLKGEEHEEVENAMKNEIMKHIEKLRFAESEQSA